MKKNIILALLAMATTHITAQEFDFNEVEYTPRQTTFRLFAPKNAKVKVLYSENADRPAQGKWNTVNMRLTKDGVWEAAVKEDLKGRFYRFGVNGQLSPGVFAKAVSVNGEYGVVVSLEETDPAGWEHDQRPVVKSPADLIIYEMHHRDFSVGAQPLPKGGEFRYAGKFLALTESRAIKHLTELGVNAVHILPSYDFGSVDETKQDKPQYNWGYDPVNYNVPEGSYSTNPYNPMTRIREFKQMVQALHKAGIRVILDVVYNHTYDIEHSNFQKTYPDYYYRKTSPTGEGLEGAYSNGSGCGNETASEKPMMRRFMIESVKYWIHEYHIDGFRFDLMGVHDIETMNEIRRAVDEIDPTIFIYGEGWSAGQCALPAEQLATKANILQMPRIAAFSDELRDGLRGPFSDDTKGAFLMGIPGEEESVKFGIAGCIDHPQVDMSKVNYSKKAWAMEPTQMISYVSCHDDMCLVDRLKASAPLQLPSVGGNPEAANKKAFPTGGGLVGAEGLERTLVRLDLLAQTAVFTSQGVPFMLSGEEMLRDKKGVHNSFESPDSINRLDWNNLKRYPQVFEYYKNLIQLRKDHPAFRLGSADLVRKHLEFFAPIAPLQLPPVGGESNSPSQKASPTEGGLVGAEGLEGALVAFRLKDHAGGDSWKDIYVILNANREAVNVSLPMDTYETVCDDGRIRFTGVRHFTADRVTVAPQSALILHN